MEINTLINKNKIKFEDYYKKLLHKKLNKNSVLSRAMIYGSMNGGKRIRPFLVSQSAKIVNLSPKYSMLISSCIESIHCYSLIHDDLPSMDDDDFRRGKLSTHKKFDEAIAILAGDALHDMAFEILSSNLQKFDPKLNLKLLNYLSICTGHNGLAGGQSLDLQYENKEINKKKIMEMYEMKTSKLFEFSFAAPFILSGEKNHRILFSKKFGLLFGIIFQIVDDLLDETNNFKKLGKTPGKDKKQGKTTLHSLIGKKKVMLKCKELVNDFINKNREEFLRNPILVKLLFFNIERLE